MSAARIKDVVIPNISASFSILKANILVFPQHLLNFLYVLCIMLNTFPSIPHLLKDFFL